MKCSVGISNFLEEIASLPILLFSSISLHWPLRKAFFSLLAILWNSAFKWVYLSFSSFLWLLFFSQLFLRPPQTAILLLCISFWAMVLISVSCTMSETSVHSSSGTLSIGSSPLNIFLTSTVSNRYVVVYGVAQSQTQLKRLQQQQQQQQQHLTVIWVYIFILVNHVDCIFIYLSAVEICSIIIFGKSLPSNFHPIKKNWIVYFLVKFWEVSIYCKYKSIIGFVLSHLVMSNSLWPHGL